MTVTDTALPAQLRGVLTIADAPFAPTSGSYKIVEFVERVVLPRELEAIRAYVITEYRKNGMFQKADHGWRLAR